MLEFLSPTDSLRTTQAKMQEYLHAGYPLGWLLNPSDRQVEIYRPGQPLEVLNAPTTLAGDPVLPRFILVLDWLWHGSCQEFDCSSTRV